MLVFEERGKLENPGKNLSQQRKNQQQTSRTYGPSSEPNPSHIGGMRVQSTTTPALPPPPRLFLLNFLNSLISHELKSLSKMDKFVTCMALETQWKPRWKPHVFWISYPNHTLFSSDSSTDIKIYAWKQKKLNQRTAFLITHFPLFTRMFTSQLPREAKFKVWEAISKPRASCFITGSKHLETIKALGLSRCLEPMMQPSHSLIYCIPNNSE